MISHRLLLHLRNVKVHVELGLLVLRLNAFLSLRASFFPLVGLDLLLLAARVARGRFTRNVPMHFVRLVHCAQVLTRQRQTSFSIYRLRRLLSHKLLISHIVKFLDRASARRFIFNLMLAFDQLIPLDLFTLCLFNESFLFGSFIALLSTLADFLTTFEFFVLNDIA